MYWDVKSYRFFVLAAVLAALPLVTFSAPSFAQISFPDYGFGARVHEPSNTCASVSMCAAESGFGDVGVFDFEIYASIWGNGVDGLRFSLEFPSTWVVLGYETCGWNITDGDPFDPQSGLELVTGDCWWESGPILRITIDCPTPGMATMGARPARDYVEYRDCTGEWVPGFSDYNPRVNIGDFCGRRDTNGPCDFCQPRVAGAATPEYFDIEVSPGDLEIRSVEISGDMEGGCYQLPECGSGGFGSCFGGLQTSLPWVSVSFINSEGNFRHNYELLFDTSGLPEGGYSGRVEILSGSCFLCDPSCIELSMLVCPSPPCPGAGACCFDDGTCTLSVEAACGRQSGDYAGDQTVCEPNPCPSGFTCCLVDGTCQILTEDACLAEGGASGQPGETCTPTPCDSGGACCSADGTCTVLIELLCAQQSGEWTEGVTCLPYPCPPIEVRPDGSGMAATIQDALDTITDGGVIELATGVFTGSGNTGVGVWGKAITLRSQAQSADSVTIDCEYDGLAIWMGSGNGPDTRIEDITFVRGNGGQGGAVNLNYASPTFERCRFLSCQSSDGAAVFTRNGNPTFIDCLFTGNVASNRGGALWTTSGFTLVGCTIVGNRADSGAGIEIWGDTGVVSLERTVIWGNCDDNGPSDISAPSTNGPRFFVTCSIVDSASVNLDLFSGDLYFEDPAFCFPEPCGSGPTEDFPGEVGSNSICLPQSNPCGVLIGAGDQGCGQVPLGSCCFSDGSCRWLSNWSCTERGGTFSSGVSCDPNPCGSPEVCCFLDLHCELLPGPICLGSGGEPFPGEPVCDPQSCTTLIVRPDGSGVFPNIQIAIDASVDGNVVELADGVFSGPGNRDLDPRGKAITIRSASGNAEDCVIDCRVDSTTAVRAFTISSGGPQTRIEEIAFRYGNAFGGGAIQVSRASPTLSGCLFESCSAERGGALYLYDSSTLIENCVFRSNTATRGGAIVLIESDATVASCVFERNSATVRGGACDVDGILAGTGPTFIRNTFNLSSSPLGSALNFTGTGTDIELDACLISFGQLGDAVTCEGSWTVTATCSDIFGNEGGDWIGCLLGQGTVSDNFSLDPIFCDAENGDLSLNYGSPCTAANSPCGSRVGALPSGCFGPADIEIAEPLPSAISLSPPQPNPTSTRSRLRFGIPESAWVELRIVDINGRTISVQVEETMSAGVHVVAWDGKSESGQTVPNGVYYVILQSGSVQLEQKLLWLR